MKTARARITPKKKPKAEPKTPIEVKVDGTTVNVDHKEFIDVMAQMNRNHQETMAAMQHMLADHQKEWLKMAEENKRLLAALDERQIVVKGPDRPNSFYVELDNDDGETVGMRISANRTN